MKIYNPTGFSSKLTGSFSGSFIGDGSNITSISSDNVNFNFTAISSSAQIADDISGSFTSTSQSLASRVASQESFSSSLDNTFATDADLNLVSSSVDSLNAATSSYLQNTSDTLTGDLTVTGTYPKVNLTDTQGVPRTYSVGTSNETFIIRNETGTNDSFQIDSLNNAYFSADVTVTGTLTAQDLHVQEVTSSIVYSSGSNIFGESTSDTQTFYGSLQVSGSTNYLLGNVGIGYSSPNYQLHVLGKTRFDAVSITDPDELSSPYTGSHTFTYMTDPYGVSIIGGQGGHTGANLVLGQETGASSNFDYIQGVADTNGSAGVQFVVNGLGNIGIGTNSPTVKLDIRETSGANIILNSSTVAANSGIYMSEGGVSTPTQNGAYFYYDGTANAIKLDSGTTSLSTKLTVIRDSGYLGVGTDDPQSLLHASGSAQNILEIDSSDGDGPYAVYRTSGTAKGYVGSAAALANAGQSNFAVRAQSDLVFATGGGTERVRIDSSGNTTFKGDLMPDAENLYNIGSAAVRWEDLYVDDGFIRDAYINEYIYHTDDTNTYIRALPDEWVFRTGGDDRFTISNTNTYFTSTNVGIGTTSPAVKLHVHATSGDGLIRVSGDNIINSGGTIKGFNNGLAFNVAASGGGSETEAIRIIGNANVGIGTTSPDAKLRIKGSGTSTGLTFKTTDSSENETFYIFDGGKAGMQYYPFVIGADSSTTVSGTYNKFAVYNASTRVVSINYQDGINTIMSHAGDPNYGLESLTIRGDYISFYTDYDPSHYQGTEKMRILANGNVGIGTTNPSACLDVQRATGTSSSSTGTTFLELHNDVGADLSQQKTFIDFIFEDDNDNDWPQVRIGAEVGQNGDANSTTKEGSGAFVVYTNYATTTDPGNPSNLNEKMRVDASGNLLVGTTTVNPASNSGIALYPQGTGHFTRGGDYVLYLNRKTNDGDVAIIAQDGTSEGSISVSGNTVSYNGFAGCHESSGIALDTQIGTVISTIDELDTRVVNDVTQSIADHAKVKVSDSIGDARVYGVLQRYNDNGKPVISSVGIGSVLVTGSCAGGDLLESNGDGYAKVQDDDIIRSKTIGKVTIGDSNNDVKLVPVVLYCG